jgi:hypothetical protein
VFFSILFFSFLRNSFFGNWESTLLWRTRKKYYMHTLQFLQE